MSGEEGNETSTLEPTKRERGRPEKRKRGGPGEFMPRKKKANDKLSPKQKTKRAQSIARDAEYDIEILEQALSIAKNINNIPKEKAIKKIEKQVMMKHSLQSALALYLDMGMTKAQSL
ncbi:hypothetical protein QAD02_007579 [Eretmocerus hayati]|uniref:Uncharacterized protein n=1 Tax=Eretmocerus hayati TaxID=131215 RepID=A0ACC2N4D2_9HYME|nr:hypothetical protein QAD02_007579 [Eretmocerus hayati]